MCTKIFHQHCINLCVWVWMILIPFSSKILITHSYTKANGDGDRDRERCTTRSGRKRIHTFNTFAQWLLIHSLNFNRWIGSVRFLVCVCITSHKRTTLQSCQRNINEIGIRWGEFDPHRLQGCHKTFKLIHFTYEKFKFGRIFEISLNINLNQSHSSSFTWWKIVKTFVKHRFSWKFKKS